MNGGSNQFLEIFGFKISETAEPKNLKLH